jgi:peptidyl-prolyl cis-trans isomerase A (cyclophilin A)
MRLREAAMHFQFPISSFKFALTRTILAAASALLFAAPLALGQASPVRVLLETQLGAITIEVDAARAPVTAANFLRYVDAGLYNGGRFHRTVRLSNQPDKKVKIEVIQAGASPAHKDFPAIPLERTNKTGLKHTDGCVSMARDAADTATSDFFICIGDQPSLDFGGARNPDGQGFAAFGRVVAGMDVARKIQAAPADGQRLAPPVTILSAKRL